MRHGGRSRPGVARRCRDKHAGVGRKQKGDLDRITEVGSGAADRVVDDVDTVGHRLVDRGHRVDGRAAALAAIAPADLVGGDAGAWRDAVDGAKYRRRPGGSHIRIAAGGGRGVRAMAIGVARRVELVGELRLDGCVAAKASVVIARSDQLLVAVRGIESLARRALAVPARDLLIRQLAVLAGIAVEPSAVGEARVLGPDAGVDDADDHALALGLGIPEAGGACEAQEVRRAAGVELEDLIARDRQHAGRLRQLLRLVFGQLGGETVEDITVVVELAAAAHAVEQLVLARAQVGQVAGDVGAVGVDLLALGRRGGAHAAQAALVRDHRLLGQLHDVGAAARRPFELVRRLIRRGLNCGHPQPQTQCCPDRPVLIDPAHMCFSRSRHSNK